VPPHNAHDGERDGVEAYIVVSINSPRILQQRLYNLNITRQNTNSYQHG